MIISLMENGRTVILTAAMVALLGVAGCNTVRGAGQDIQQGGQAIEETAEDLTDGNPETP